jgi:flagellar basal-body rod modification protein FlgD
MSVITPTDATTQGASADATTPTNPNGQLGDDQFLQLMVDQLKAQDPLNPTDTSSYLSELAQFTSVEQETSTASSTATTEALSLLGSMITYSANGQAVTGMVTSVDLSGASPTLTVGGTAGITTSQVQSVS